MKKMAKRRGNNEGSISKLKDGTWRGYLTVGYNPETKKSKRKYFYGKTRKEVKEKMTEIAGNVQNGTYKEASKMKVAEWFKIWLEEYQKQSLRQTTYESYEMQIDKHILPYIVHLQLKQLETYHLQALYNEKQKDGARLDGKKGPLSPRSIRYIHMICHASLEQAKKEGRLIINPADATKVPADKKKEIQYLDTEQVKKFLAGARESRHFAAYYLVLNTGLRRGELLALRWKDVDLKEGSVTVNQSLVRTKNGLIFQAPKTKLSNRTISISKQVINELKMHWRRQEGEKAEAEDSYENNGLVFCNELGQKLCPRAFTRHYEKIYEKINREADAKGKKENWTKEQIEAEKITPVNFHALRHTFATLSLQEGTDPRTIQEALGHYKVSFTLDVYSGVTSRMKKEATDKIGRLMASCLK